MVLGSDFDNTIVSYDGVFHQIAVEKGLILENIPTTKDAVRDYLRGQGKEDDWTEMQGLVYGAKMDATLPYSGVVSFFSFCREIGVPVRIISHKTRYPIKGERYNLHKSASSWLKRNYFYYPSSIGISEDEVYFETTREDKMLRIHSSGCTHFIDDLPEFLLHPKFPPNVQRWLFDPYEMHVGIDHLKRFSSWKDVQEEVQATVLA